MGDYGMKVSQKGFDVNNCKDYQLVFSSSFPTLKIAMMGSKTISNMTQDVTIATHSLGYIPVFFVFDNNRGSGKFCVSTSGVSQFIGMSGTDLKWLGATRGGPAGSITLYYFIFRYNLATSFTATQVSTTDGSKVTKDDYGIKVSRVGKNINSTDLRDYVIHSNTRSPIIHKTGSGTFGAGGGNVTIAHNLGYPPMFFLFGALADWADGRTQQIFNSDDSFVTADNSNCIFYAPYQMTYYYVILADPMLID